MGPNERDISDLDIETANSVFLPGIAITKTDFQQMFHSDFSQNQILN